ncbi:DNA starvation/stationary phase protection protein [Agromyces sp. CFH 90414]|uniref:DNA starvation/stationary phase protection protein n=1 Tax=Agromyces agglutinans TaxID=2662258 RepID=A0A6I2F335_9MICO|nr:DNA starvation/stationary phase protection protein [Agromyces agglutinans]MRG58611.1 DNA starvation/stationary phase protection protein [Agromyces agglutinans]
MTDTIAPKTGSNAEVASGVAQFFTPIVHHLVALAVNGKQAHWHVRGHNFIEVHEFLDTVVEHAQGWADEAAERVIALGLPIDARLETVAKHSGAVNPKAGFKQSDDTIADVIAQIDLATEQVNAAIEGLAELDPSSQDIAISIRQGLDKDRWFLAAHLSVS